MTSTNRIGLVLAAFVMLAGTSSLAQLPIQDIQLFNSVGIAQNVNKSGRPGAGDRWQPGYF